MQFWHTVLATVFIFGIQILFMVGCGLLRPVPNKARSDTPKKFKQLCIDCCKVSRDDRPTFDFVSACKVQLWLATS